MKKITIVFILTVTTSIGLAQKNSLAVSVGTAKLIPTYTGISSIGFGFSTSVDYKLTKNISFISDIDVDIFNSKVKNNFTNKITDGFIIMPVLVGAKWNAFSNFYFTSKAGFVTGLKNAGTNFSLSPGLGYLININGNRKLDIGLKLVGVLPKSSIPENTFLERGGYSFLSLRVAYQL
jgi:hypothetical protein